MKKWTPGPWWHSDLIETNDLEVWCGDGLSGAGPYQICQLINYRRILPSDHRLVDVPQRANAYLIAAAPEMATALQQCLDVLENMTTLPATVAPLQSGDADAAMQLARLALSKAVGQIQQ